MYIYHEIFIKFLENFKTESQNKMQFDIHLLSTWIHENKFFCGTTYLRQYYRQYYCTTAVVLGLFPLARFAGTTAVVTSLPLVLPP